MMQSDQRCESMLLRQLLQQRQQIKLFMQIKCTGGLIEQQDGGLFYERLGNEHELPLSTTQCHDAARSKFLHIQPPQHVLRRSNIFFFDAERHRAHASQHDDLKDT